ncbi:hypothetical protein [Bradyrhizobium sp. S3.2.12]|uniref:hypothetical protein n=1 Tax=Bradyrhizobium sp. S3.2.12 TaxID=3156387 RepID=UPI0033963C00
MIAGDVDGTTSTPYKIDRSAPSLTRYSATKRIARAIFMGTAPKHQQQNAGVDDKKINLGVVHSSERPVIFVDALRRLTNQAKFMHADLGRYWYSISASLNRIAADRAGTTRFCACNAHDRQGIEETLAPWLMVAISIRFR